jgi:mannitol/fructose-specific phosphotransferase system IIA component (Ntr-type)
MRLKNFLDARLVLLGLDAADTESALEAIARHTARHVDGLDAQAVNRALLVREATHSTAMGAGVAIPHATLPELDETLLILAVQGDGIAFGGPGDEPTRVFFTLLSPPDRESQHIKLLARICRLIRHPGFIDALLASDSPDAAVDVIASVDAQHV